LTKEPLVTKEIEMDDEKWKLHVLADGDWPLDKVLEGARIELVSSKATKLHRHIYQCLDCGKTVTQLDYEGRTKKCECGLYMVIRYTLVSKRLFNGLTGQEISAKRGKGYNTNLLKTCRKKRNISQIQLAEMFGVTQQFISQIESNERPIPKSIMAWIEDA